MGQEKKFTTKLSNVKASGLNVVPPNAFKALNDKDITWLLIFYSKFWSSQADFDRFYEGQVVPVPQKDDTSNPNNWIGVTLTDTVNKIYSSIMCEQLFKIISKHSVK